MDGPTICRRRPATTTTLAFTESRTRSERTEMGCRANSRAPFVSPPLIGCLDRRQVGELQSPFTSGHYGFWGAGSRKANQKMKKRQKPQFYTVSSDGKVQKVAFHCISDLA